MNAVMAQYLWAHVNYLQDDSSEWLTLADFSVNNQAPQTTGLSPFFAHKGFHPHFEFDLSMAATNDINDQ
jgi:hypothetical protein